MPLQIPFPDHPPILPSSHVVVCQSQLRATPDADTAWYRRLDLANPLGEFASGLIGRLGRATQRNPHTRGRGQTLGWLGVTPTASQCSRYLNHVLFPISLCLGPILDTLSLASFAVCLLYALRTNRFLYYISAPFQRVITSPSFLVCRKRLALASTACRPHAAEEVKKSPVPYVKIPAEEEKKTKRAGRLAC